ncbi:D-hexose-6-phosphate mutarotase [Pseudomonas sp. N040]|uniref:D-hexose-6-phosphate mutarotase n=1 Tax=Pseudomonas sp. N040 TaxID=2785325 RepID=UPI0018A30D6A|nr:D-hexose-6-phosphate mutarotase [Pseudomonas sp. N040]MBF7728962.1 D-hexose-6-phosphate mutarotase [Pseudomonas sp. N040]MBW7012602.1 D-hexose-6-phosphate mutarotase [Pseudomonas sp. N040]
MSSSRIERIEREQLVCWRVTTAGAELLVAEQGAQILSYRRHGEPPLIWLSEQARYLRGQGVRGGVPVCWPWFGDLQRNPPAVRAMVQGAAPFHGLARSLAWQLLEVLEQAGAVRLSFALALPDGLPGWPHAASLRLEIELGEQLHMRLTTRNLGAAPLAISQALHSYFAVSDIRQVRVHGLDGCRYIETLDDWSEQQQAGAVQFAGETDRIYLDLPARLELHDAGWQRRLVLEASGSRSAVVWNPWLDKSRQLTQFAADAWQGMLCIETANVLDDHVLLLPGGEHVLGLSLSSEALDE